MASRRPAPIEPLICALPLFRGAAAARISKLSASARRIELRKGDHVYESGGEAQGLYAVAFGLLKLSFSQPNGHAKVLRLVGAGETFGEPAVFYPHPYPVSAEALTDTLVLFMPAAAVMDIVESDPYALRSMLGTLSRRIAEMVDDLQSHTAKNGVQRVAAYLCSLCEPTTEHPAPDTACKVRLPTRKSVVASRLGVTKETFSRILHELADAGLISVARLEITLVSPQRLDEVARQGMPGPGAPVA